MKKKWQRKYEWEIKVGWLFVIFIVIMLILMMVKPSRAADDYKKIYDKDWQLVYRFKDNKIYDKDWNLRYRLKDNKIYDKDWNRLYDTKDEEKKNGRNYRSH